MKYYRFSFTIIHIRSTISMMMINAHMKLVMYSHFRHFMFNSLWKNVYNDIKRKNKKIELRNHKFYSENS